MQIYTIYDSKAGAYLQPFFAKTEGVAIRYIRSALQDEKHEFFVHAEDYSLWHIGAFDELSAEISAYPPKHIGAMHHFKQAELLTHEQSD